MSEIDRAELRRLLDEATPGPWWHEWVDGDDWWAVYGQPTGDMVCPEVCTMWSSDEAAYIAAVNPAVVLGLLDALGKAERHRGSLAQAWDEGFYAGVAADMGDWEHPPEIIPNPYRQEG